MAKNYLFDFNKFLKRVSFLLLKEFGKTEAKLLIYQTTFSFSAFCRVFGGLT